MAAPVHPVVRIVIADDHPLFREGLQQLLESDPEFLVVGQGADGIEAVQLVRDLAPDILLLDFAMPRANGIAALRELARSGGVTRVVLLTASIEQEESVLALQLGARGIVLKDSSIDLVFRCIRSVASGQYWVGHERVSDLVEALRRENTADADGAPKPRLTARERDVVGAIVEGATNKDIAQQFGVSEQTVKNHLSNIFDKLGLSNRLELALYAVHHRLLEDDDRGGAPTVRQ